MEPQPAELRARGGSRDPNAVELAVPEGCEQLHKPRASTGGGTRPAPTPPRRKAGSFPAKPSVRREMFAGAGATTAGLQLSLRGWKQQPGCCWSPAGTQRVPRDSQSSQSLAGKRPSAAGAGNAVALGAQAGAIFGKSGLSQPHRIHPLLSCSAQSQAVRGCRGPKPT